LIVAHSHNLQANSDASVEVLARAAGEANSAHRRGAIDHCWERISRQVTTSRRAARRLCDALEVGAVCVRLRGSEAVDRHGPVAYEYLSPFKSP